MAKGEIMTMPTTFVDSDLVEGAVLVMEGPSSRYLSRVLRVRSGDEVRLLHEGGVRAFGEVCSVSREAVTCRIRRVETVCRPSPAIHLVFSPLKRKAIQTVVTGCSELGIARFVLVPMRRSVARSSPDRIDHLRELAREACRQVGWPHVPSVDALDSLDAALDQYAGSAGVFLWEHANDDLEWPPGVTGSPLFCVLGPEGGFDTAEIEQLTLRGIIGLSLGDTPLKADTAAVAGSAVLIDRCRRRCQEPSN